MTEFPEGEFLGLGSYSTSEGDEGDFASYADIGSDYWVISHYMNNKIHTYTSFFYFDDNGFFDVEVTKVKEDGEEETFYGRGYCRSVQCHYAIDLGDSIIEETATFLQAKNRIYWLGSFRPHGYDDDKPSISWETSMMGMNE